MIHDLIVALWFFLPAGAANVAPILVAKARIMTSLAVPLDGGAHWRGKRVFGDNKTWRGMVAGVIAAVLAFGAQQWIVHLSPTIGGYFANIDYLSLPTILMGTLFALGALGGDAIESFFKRKRGIPAGRAWIPFDQLDYIIGSILLTMPLVLLTLPQYAWALVCWCGIHICVSYLGYKLGFKPRPI